MKLSCIIFLGGDVVAIASKNIQIRRETIDRGIREDDKALKICKQHIINGVKVQESRSRQNFCPGLRKPHKIIFRQVCRETWELSLDIRVVGTDPTESVNERGELSIEENR